MPNRPSISDLINELRYQYPTYRDVTIYECSTDWCKAGTRGGLYCRTCSERRLGRRVGAVVAGRLARLFQKRQDVKRDIDKVLKEILSS